MNKIIFLDRDGVINKKAPEHEHITRIEDFIILPRVKEAISLAAAAGYKIIVITNQRGVPSHICALIHAYMKSEIPQLDGVYTCNHEDGVCCCRKPLPGLFYKVEKDFDVDKSASWMIGDSQSDIEAANAYGIKSILTDNLYNAIKEIIS